MLRSPHAHARITRLDVTRARKAPGVAGCVHGRRRRRVATDALRLALPNANLKVAKYPCVATRHRPLRRRHRRGRRRRDAVSGATTRSSSWRSNTSRCLCRSIRRRRCRLARRSCTTTCRTTSRFTGRWPAATWTPRSRMPRVVIKERIVQQRLIPERDGTARGTGEMARRLRRADAVEHDAESAHPPVPRARS